MAKKHEYNLEKEVGWHLLQRLSTLVFNRTNGRIKLYGICVHNDDTTGMYAIYLESANRMTIKTVERMTDYVDGAIAMWNAVS